MTSEIQASPSTEMMQELEATRECTPELLMHDFTSESFAWSKVKYAKSKTHNTNNDKYKNNSNNMNSNNKYPSDNIYIMSEWPLRRQVSSITECERQQEHKLEEEEKEMIETDHVPSARFGHSSIVLEDKMIVFGGRDRHRYLNDVHVYNILEQCWTDTFTYEHALQQEIAQLQFRSANTRHSHVSHESNTENDAIHSNSQSLLDETNVEINWPAARCGHSAVEYHNDMYIICGNMNEHNVCASDMWKLSLKHQNWTCLSSCLPFAARKGHSSHVLLASQTAQRSKYDMLVTFGGLTCKRVESSETEESSLSSSLTEEEEETQQSLEVQNQEAQVHLSHNTHNLHNTLTEHIHSNHHEHHLLELQHSHSHEHNPLAPEFTNEELTELSETGNEDEVYESVSNEVLLYKFETLCWSLLTTCGEVPCGRFYHSAQIVDGTTLLLVFGGRTKVHEHDNNNDNNSGGAHEQPLENNRRNTMVERVLNDLYVLDISTGMWRNITIKPTTATLHNLWHGNQKDVTNITINDSRNSNTIEMSNTDSRENSNVMHKALEQPQQNEIWPPPRKCATSVYANGKFVILSGINDLHECCHDGYEFDCYTQQWRHFTMAHQPACSCPTVVRYKTRLLLFGGYAAEENQFVNSIYELILPPLSLRNASLLWLRTVMLHEALFSQSQRTKLQRCNTNCCCSSSSSFSARYTNPSNNFERKYNNAFVRREQSETIPVHDKESFQLTRSYTEPVYYGVGDYDIAPSTLPVQVTNYTNYNYNNLNNNNHRWSNNSRVQADKVNTVSQEGRSRAREYCVYGNDNNFMHFTHYGNLAPKKDVMYAYAFNPHFMHNLPCTNTYYAYKRVNAPFRDEATYDTNILNSYNSNNNNISGIYNNCCGRKELQEEYDHDGDTPFQLTRAYTEPITNSNTNWNRKTDINTHHNNVFEHKNNSKLCLPSALPSSSHQYTQMQFLQHQEHWCSLGNKLNINHNPTTHVPQADSNEQSNDSALSRAATEGNFVINSCQSACTCSSNMNSNAPCRHHTSNLPMSMCVPSPLNPPAPYLRDSFFPHPINGRNFPHGQHTKYNVCATHQYCATNSNVNTNLNCIHNARNDENNDEYDYGVYGLDSAFANIAYLPPPYHSQMAAFLQNNACMSNHTNNNYNNAIGINNKQMSYEREKNDENSLLMTRSHTFTSPDIVHNNNNKNNNNRYCECVNQSRQHLINVNEMSNTNEPLERAKSENVFSVVNNKSTRDKHTWNDQYNCNSKNYNDGDTSRKCMVQKDYTKQKAYLPQFHELLSSLQGAHGPYALQNTLQSLNLMKAKAAT